MSEWTEEEAKQRWCPAARVEARTTADNAAQGCNRAYKGGPDNGALCLATGCMAWRWTEAKHEQKRSHAMTVERLQMPAGEGWQPAGDVEVSKTRGFYQDWVRVRPARLGTCGLAGGVGASRGFDGPEF